MVKKGMAQLAKILTIEDDETTAQEIVTELSSHGFEVEWASNGKDGLELALSGHYDLITLDRMLPFIDGLAIVTTLREINSRWAHLREPHWVRKIISSALVICFLNMGMSKQQDGGKGYTR
jgi:CheY-like chemotaxis protein